MTPRVRTSFAPRRERRNLDQSSYSTPRRTSERASSPYATRDGEACKEKYGKDWDKYTALVRYRLIPYLY